MRHIYTRRIVLALALVFVLFVAVFASLRSV
jgi:hypothetical protein